MRVVYIAGRFRAETAWEIEQNVRKAEEVALDVWKMGAAALCPHTNTRFFHEEAPDVVFERGYIALLRRCDAIVLLPGWGHSGGARGEHAEARRLNIAVFNWPDQVLALKKWIDEESMGS